MDPNGNPDPEADPEDIGDDGEDIEVIEVEEEPDDVAGEMGDMELEGYEGEDAGYEGEYEGEGEYEEGEEGYEEREEMEEEDIQDDAEAKFTQHTGSVFCCDIDEKGSGLAVTGGEDDKAYIWNIADGSIASECSGHKDSVTNVSFSHDGSMVATGDMSGIIKVWRLDKMDEIWSFEGSDLEWLTWHHSTAVLLAGTAEGDVWMWKIPSGDCKTMLGHGCQTTCGKILPDGKQCCIGYEDGTIKVWDLKQSTAVHSFKGGSGVGHAEGVTSLDCHENSVLTISGSVDGTAKLLNMNTGKVLATFSAGPVNATIGDTNSVETVALCNSHPFAAVGSLNGALTIWDISTQTLRHMCQHEAGIVRVKWDPSGSTNVFTAGLDGCIRLWDARSGQIVTTWVGHRGEILDMAIGRDGTTVVTASGDTTARVFTLQKPDR